MITNENSPDPRRRLGKNLNDPDKTEQENTEELEKGASNIDIKNRDAGSQENKGESTAPSGELVNNTGEDINSNQTDADAATG